jgi:hypothetical protein
MSIKQQRKQRIDRVPFGGFALGQSSLDQKLIQRGAAKSLRNLRPYGNISLNRNGWKTLANGLTSSNTWTWTAATKDVGFFDPQGFIRSDDGKIAVFEERLFYDTDADTDDFDGGGSIDADAGQSFEGGFYAASTFYVFSKEKLYSLNLGGGTKTEVVDFSTQIGASYDSVIQMFNRFGETWAVSDKFSRLFLSDSGVVEIADGSQVDDEYLSKIFDIWQRLDTNILSTTTAPVVEYSNYRNILAYFPVIGTPTVTQAGENHCYMASWAFDSGVIGNGDVIALRAGIGQEDPILDSQTISANAPAECALNSNVSAGATTIPLTGGTDDEHLLFYGGARITISDDSNSEEVLVDGIISVTGAPVTNLRLQSALQNSYVAANNGKVVIETIQKVTIVNTWNVDSIAGSVVFSVEEFANAVLDTDYNITNDPDSTDNVDGHVRLIATDNMAAAVRIRITYTPLTNPWLEGNSGFIDVAKDQGEIVEVIDTRAGLYIFKKNPGSIWLLTGEPGPNATPGTLRLFPIYNGGITAIRGSIQGTRSGIYFSALDVNKIETYFFPLSQQKVDDIPKLSQIHQLTVTSQTIKARSAIVHGDMYLLTLYTTTDDYPDEYDYSYLCQAYYDGRMWQGRWYEWEDDQEEEYDADNPTHTVVATPRTIGYYEFDGNLFRIYVIPSAADQDEKQFELARYGIEDGHESPVDNIKMLYNTGGGPAIVTYDDGFYLDIETGWFSIPDIDMFTVESLLFDLMASAGDCEVSFYKNLSTTAFLTKTATSMSDAAGSERFMRDLRLNFNCQYLKIRLRFKDVDSASAEEFVQIRDLMLNIAVKSQRGNITQANIFS